MVMDVATLLLIVLNVVVWGMLVVLVIPEFRRKCPKNDERRPRE